MGGVFGRVERDMLSEERGTPTSFSVYSKSEERYMQKKPSDRAKKPFGSLKEEQKTVRIDQEGIKEQIHIFFKES